MTKNLFITFEGIEGCGKSTQAKKLHDYLLKNNHKNILTREPGGTQIGNEIRTILLNEREHKMQSLSEVLLNYASRLEHLKQVIKPALEQGKVVISDRFSDSTIAYQGYGLGVDFSVIQSIQKMVIGDFAPDITFLLDLEVSQAFERIKLRADNNRYEKLDYQFHEKVRAGFLNLAKQNQRIKIINANQNSEQVFLEIVNNLKQFI